MYRTRLHLRGHHPHKFHEGGRGLIEFGRLPLALQRLAVATIGVHCAAVWLAATVLVGALWLGLPVTASAANPVLSDLRDRVCAPHGSECRELWTARVAHGDNFDTLAETVCLTLRYRVHELDGIVCLETFIQGARTLPVGIVAAGTLASPVNALDEGPLRDPDPQWKAALDAYLAGIPSFCDQITPVIFNYFDCLLRELQNVEVALRHRM